jgi:YlmC/YmxH family sporulation protein
MFKATDLASRDVINVVDGRRLGPLKDLEIDYETGMVQALVLQSRERYLKMFRRGRDVVVPWTHIKKIGVDAILVELPPTETFRS